jgi:hypothetical protein
VAHLVGGLKHVPLAVAAGVRDGLDSGIVVSEQILSRFEHSDLRVNTLFQYSGIQFMSLKSGAKDNQYIHFYNNKLYYISSFVVLWPVFGARSARAPDSSVFVPRGYPAAKAGKYSAFVAAAVGRMGSSRQ